MLILAQVIGLVQILLGGHGSLLDQLPVLALMHLGEFDDALHGHDQDKNN